METIRNNQEMTGKLKAYIRLTLIEHSIIALTGLFCGVFLALGKFSVTGAILPLILIEVLMVCAFNSFNNVCDAHLDKISKPDRPIPSGKISKKSALTLAAIFYIIIFVIAYSIQNTLIFTLVSLNALLTIAYSAQHIRFKDKFLLTNLTVSAQYGFFPLVIGWSLYQDFYTLPLQILIFAFVLAFSTSITENFGVDYVGDKKHNVRTFLVVFGPQTAGKIVSALLFFPFAWIGINVWFGIFGTWTLATLIFLPLVLKIVNNLIKHPADEEGEVVIRDAAILYIIMFLLFTFLYLY